MRHPVFYIFAQNFGLELEESMCDSQHLIWLPSGSHEYMNAIKESNEPADPVFLMLLDKMEQILIMYKELFGLLFYRPLFRV